MPAWHAAPRRVAHLRLEASGAAVGLPAGQMGNSEVGHLNLGAGFPCSRTCRASTEAIADGSFYDQPCAARRRATMPASAATRLHLLGLIGPGGIHAVDEHIVAMAELAHRRGLPGERVLLHAFTDGRDTPPRSAAASSRRSRRGSPGRATHRDGERPLLRDGSRPALGADEARLGCDRPRRGAPSAAAPTRPWTRRTRADVSDEFIEPTVIVDDTARWATATRWST